MKYSIKDYARALAEVATGKHSEAKSATIRKNFLALIRKNGATSRLPKIIEEAGRILREKEGLRKVTFESARPLSSDQKKSLGSITRKEDILEEKVDSSLIAGIRVVINDERQFDASLAKRLQRMFAK